MLSPPTSPPSPPPPGDGLGWSTRGLRATLSGVEMDTPVPPPASSWPPGPRRPTTSGGLPEPSGCGGGGLLEDDDPPSCSAVVPSGVSCIFKEIAVGLPTGESPPSSALHETPGPLTRLSSKDSDDLHLCTPSRCRCATPFAGAAGSCGYRSSAAHTGGSKLTFLPVPSRRSPELDPSGMSHRLSGEERPPRRRMAKMGRLTTFPWLSFVNTDAKEAPLARDGVTLTLVAAETVDPPRARYGSCTKSLEMGESSLLLRQGLPE